MLVHAPTEPGRPIDEASPIDPKWQYPKSKLDAENVVRTRHGQTPTLMLRIAGMSTDQCDSATPRCSRSSASAPVRRTQYEPCLPRRYEPRPGLRSLRRPAPGRVPLSVDRRHRLPADLTLADRLSRAGRRATPNWSKDQLGWSIHGAENWPTPSISKAVAKTGAWLQDKVEDAVPDAIDQGKEPFIKPFMVELADDHFELDISSARQALDWEPKHQLRATLPRMVQALKADRSAWYARTKLTSPAGVGPCRAPR